MLACLVPPPRPDQSRASASRTKRTAAACLLVPLLAAVHGWWFLGTGPVDDDYICYRYAHNFLAGHGLVFNAGDVVEGFSTPLWVFLHAAWQAVGGDSPALSVSLGAGAWVACVAWLSRLAWRQGRLPSEALIVAAAPAMAWHAMAGLGTTLLALCLVGAYLRFSTAPMQSAAWLALAVGLRQEASLYLIPLALACKSRRRLLALSLPLLVLAGWTVFRLVYYGRWLPATYATKKLPLSADLGYGWRYLLEASVNLGWPLLLSLGLLGAWRSREPAQRAFITGVLLHTAYVVWVGGDFMVLSRYFVPAYPLLVVLAWNALRPHRRLAVALSLVAAAGMQWNQIGQHRESRETRLLVQRTFKQRWARLGEHFGRLLPLDTKVAISPIGAFGWTSGLAIVDILGLVNESARGEPPRLACVEIKGHHRSNFDWILDQEPHFVILGGGVRNELGQFAVSAWERDFYESARNGGRFPRRYRQACMDLGDGMPLDVFVRRDLELPPGTRWVAP